MRIEYWKAVSGWYWHLKSRNGKIVVDAEAFLSRANVRRAAKALVRGVYGKQGVTFEETFDKAKQHGVLRWS